MATLPADQVGEVRYDFNKEYGNGTDVNLEGHAFLYPNLKPGTPYRAFNVDVQHAYKIRCPIVGGMLRDPSGTGWPKVLGSDASGHTHPGMQWVIEPHLKGVEQPNAAKRYFTVPAGGYVNVGLIPDTSPQPNRQYVYLHEPDVLALVEEAENAEAGAQGALVAAQGVLSSTQAVAAGIEEHRQYVEGLVVTDLGTTDGQSTALFNSPTSQLRQAANAAFGRGRTGADWRQFIAQASMSRGRIRVCGDSIPAGVNASETTSWPTVLESLLAAEGIPLAGDGFSHPYPASVPTTRWNFTGSWTFGPASTGKQLGGRSGAAGDTATYQAVRPSTEVTVLAYGGQGTGFTVEVDGVARGTLSTTGTADIRKLTITNLPKIAHTVKVTALAVGDLLVGVSTQGNGIVVDNVGRSGASSSTWAESGAQDLRSLVEALPNGAGVAATIVALGVNDAIRALQPTDNGTTVTDYRTHLTDLIAWAQTAGKAVLVASPVPVGQAVRDQPLSAYADAALAITPPGQPFLDMLGRWATYQVAVAEGFMTNGETVHPIAGGHADYAAAVADAIVSLPVVGLHPASDGYPEPPVGGYSARYRSDTGLSSPVASWPEVSGAGTPLVQGTEANRPTVVSEAGVSVVEMNGTGRISRARSNTTEVTVIALVRFTAVQASKNIIGVGGAFLNTDANASPKIRFGGSTFANSNVAVETTGWHVIAGRYNATTGAVTVDTVHVTGDPGTKTGSGLAVGVASGAPFRVAEVLTYDSYLTDGQVDAVRAFLRASWPALV